MAVYIFGPQIRRDDHYLHEIFLVSNPTDHPTFSTMTTNSKTTISPVTVNNPIHQGYGKIALTEVDVTADPALDILIQALETEAQTFIDDPGQYGPGTWAAASPSGYEDFRDTVGGIHYRLPLEFDSYTDLSRFTLDLQSFATVASNCKSDVCTLLNNHQFAVDFRVIGLIVHKFGLKIQLLIEVYNVVV